MRKSFGLFVVFCLGLLVSVPAEATKAKRKPWLSVKAAKTAPAPTVAVDLNVPGVIRTPAPVSLRATKRTRTVLRTKRRPASYARRNKLRTASEPLTETVSERSLDVDAKGQRIADQALQYKGTRYRFGGTNKKGIDCSGLVARVYEDLKMKRVPRMSAALYKSGRAVRSTELEPGDLVFFKNTYKRGVSHVGVYAGKNKFIHASSSRGVTVTKMSDPYYQLHYAGARRLY